MKLYDPSNNRDFYEYTESMAEISIRGNSTYKALKHQYRLDLVTESGENNPVSLLNMRKDEDWILNIMVVDTSFLKEAISLEIWNNLNPLYKHELKFVELFLNGNYQGIYALMEKVDFKTFGGCKTDDFIVKINWKSGDIDSPILGDISSITDIDYYHNNKCEIDEFEITPCNELILIKR